MKIIFNTIFDEDMISDQVLTNYVDQVFSKYDRDNSGTLNPTELTNFFNDVFQLMGNPTRINEFQTRQAMQSIDKNYDGLASKM